MKILVQGLTKGVLEQFVREEPYFEARVQKVIEQPVIEVSIEVGGAHAQRQGKDRAESSTSRIFRPRSSWSRTTSSIPGVLADLVASNLRLKIEESQSILEIYEPVERLRKINELLTRELDLATMQARIQNQAKDEMSKTQREYFLRGAAPGRFIRSWGRATRRPRR